MQSWNRHEMQAIGSQVFAKIKKRKAAAQPNHDIHFLARDIDGWLPDGINKLIAGDYDPQHLQRFHFKDEMVEQLEITDRVFQHILLKQLKPTFKHIINPNCLHLLGPNGVKVATQRIKEALQGGEYLYIIRADIKGFYSSIPHFKLIEDIKHTFADPKVQAIMERVITNPIETPWGYKNPDKGIALRGPLSQMFSAIYLKPLDDAFNNMDVFYVRYQDDLIVLCKTKRQLGRARQKMRAVLQERRLELSRKKSRIGRIDAGFHFLGINYPGTQTQDNTKLAPSNEMEVNSVAAGRKMSGGGK